MKVIISHPTGNAFFRAAALGLYNAGMLSEFWTTVATFPGNIFDKLGQIGSLNEFKRRAYDPKIQPYAHLYPWYELGRFAALKAGFKNLTKHESGIFSVDGVYSTLDKQIAAHLEAAIDKPIAKAVYNYEDGAFFTFQTAKKRDFTCLYDLPIGYWRAAKRLLEKERERWPEWASTLSGLEDSHEKLARKDEELRLSDKIFVASQFTANTLKDYPGILAPIHIIPYAFPPIFGNRTYKIENNAQPLKLLFVGGLSQRKGIADLFAAVNYFGKSVELTVVGKKSTENCKAMNTELAKHKWIPSLPHQEILSLMRENDVLVFPSLFEGFGLVITEAMSQGTPVITTDRTAGPDLIEHGKNGWLIEAGSTIALQEMIDHLLKNRGLIPEVGKEAIKTASKRNWDIYGKELITAIDI